ncbi:MAG TPA: choice-of-anchor L domain-containing protein [Polyangiaceae bacterium]|jgi:hypothetical protein
MSLPTIQVTALARSLVVVTVVAAAAACAADPTPDGFAHGSSSSSGSSSGGAGNGSGGSSSGDGGFGSFGEGGGGGATAQDGGSGSGPVDTTPACDTSLAIDDPSAADFAQAIGICTTAASKGYGLVSATYSKAFGSTAPPHDGQWGLLPSFGSAVKPREGSRLGVLSSGYAREYDDSQGQSIGSAAQTCGSASLEACCWSGINGACPVGAASDFVNSSPDGPLEGTSYPTGVAPPGFPQSGASCPQGKTVNDMIDLKLTLEAPPDATGFRFDFDFYSSEWPNFVCSNYNDAFVAYLTSKGLTDNVSFDAQHNPVSVNNDYFDHCTAGVPLGCNRTDGNSADAPVATSQCASGASELAGTGYAGTKQSLCGQGPDATLGGATGWLTTQASIEPGEQFTLEFMIWDAGDGILDSSVLIDHFVWIGGSASSPPSTQPVQ